MQPKKYFQRRQLWRGSGIWAISEAEFSSSDYQACRTLYAPKIMLAVPTTDNCICGGFPFMGNQHVSTGYPAFDIFPNPETLLSPFSWPFIDTPVLHSKEWEWALVPSKVIMNLRESSHLLFNNPWEHKTKSDQNDPRARRLVNISHYRYYRGNDINTD